MLKISNSDYPKGVYLTFEEFRSKNTFYPNNYLTEDQIAFRFNDMDNKGKNLKSFCYF
jgi:hypothetical protein